jgi:transcriptional regulator with XRE-family HTH domain
MVQGELMYEQIRNLREDRDLSQKKMAELLNVTQATYSRYESGTLDIPSISLIKLAMFHKTSIDFLVGITNEKSPYPRKRKRL